MQWRSAYFSESELTDSEFAEPGSRHGHHSDCYTRASATKLAAGVPDRAPG